MKKKTKKQRQADEGMRWLWAICAGASGYIVAELVLRGRPHPLHWLAMGLAGVTAYFAHMLRENLSRRS